MPIDEYGRYETASGTKVHMKGISEHEEMMFRFGFELSQILGILNKPPEERDKLLKDHEIISGITDDLIFPSGYRDQQTGKCLGGNTGGVMGRGDELRERLANFDIKVDEQKK